MDFKEHNNSNEIKSALNIPLLDKDYVESRISEVELFNSTNTKYFYEATPSMTKKPCFSYFLDIFLNDFDTDSLAKSVDMKNGKHSFPPLYDFVLPLIENVNTLNFGKNDLGFYSFHNSCVNGKGYTRAKLTLCENKKVFSLVVFQPFSSGVNLFQENFYESVEKFISKLLEYFKVDVHAAKILFGVVGIKDFPSSNSSLLKNGIENNLKEINPDFPSMSSVQNDFMVFCGEGISAVEKARQRILSFS